MPHFLEHPLLSLSAKTMSLKIYHQTGEHDLPHSHLKAMKNSIRRKSMLGYHRKYHLNLVQYTQHLAAVDWRNAAAVEQLKKKFRQSQRSQSVKAVGAIQAMRLARSFFTCVLSLYINTAATTIEAMTT